MIFGKKQKSIKITFDYKSDNGNYIDLELIEKDAKIHRERVELEPSIEYISKTINIFDSRSISDVEITPVNSNEFYIDNFQLQILDKNGKAINRRPLIYKLNTLKYKIKNIMKNLFIIIASLLVISCSKSEYGWKWGKKYYEAGSTENWIKLSKPDKITVHTSTIENTYTFTENANGFTINFNGTSLDYSSEDDYFMSYLGYSYR